MCGKLWCCHSAYTSQCQPDIFGSARFIEKFYFVFVLSKYSSFSEFQMCYQLDHPLIFGVGITFTEVCNFSKVYQIPSFSYQALWHSSQFQPSHNHSAGSSAQCTRFVITCPKNRTSTQKNNSLVIVLGNANRWRKTYSTFTKEL